MERRKSSWPVRERQIGEEKANRKSPEFRNRTKPMKTKTHRNSNSVSKRVFRFTVMAPVSKEALAAEASPIAKEASSNIASGRISVNSMNAKEKANL